MSQVASQKMVRTSLSAKNIFGIAPAQASAAFALATTWSKPVGSLPAISARSLRSIVILAFFSPSMNRLYVEPAFADGGVEADDP